MKRNWKKSLIIQKIFSWRIIRKKKIIILKTDENNFNKWNSNNKNKIGVLQEFEEKSLLIQKKRLEEDKL